MAGYLGFDSLLISVALFSLCYAADSYPKKAIATLFTNRGSGTGGTTFAQVGTVIFTQSESGGPVNIKGQIINLPKGSHGFHIHKIGTIEPNCEAALEHFNPMGKEHGNTTGDNRHIGDMGNIISNEFNQANVDFNMSAGDLPLSGANSIIGRSLVIHEKGDDLGLSGQAESKTTGNAGSRLACGVIGIGSDFTVGGAASPRGISNFALTLVSAVFASVLALGLL